MADKSESSGNLDVQKGINEAIAARTALLSKQTDIMKGQVQLAVELCKALKCEDLDGVASRVQEISSSLAASQKEAENFANKMKGASGAIGNASKKMGAADTKAASMNKRLGAAAEAAQSFGDAAGAAFSAAMSQLDSIVSLAGAVGRGIFSIAQSIIAIPLGIFNKLLGMASDLASQTDPLREAMEDVRKTFGDLSKGEARQTLDAFNEIRQSAGSLAGSGLALSKVYGYGREGLAAALRDVLQTAEAMGPVFGALGDQFTDNAASLLIMQKGLGMTGEDMKAFGAYALSTGQNVNDVLMETANMSLQMGEKFGISSKLIGKDMAYMTQNIGKFGSMTKTQMATATIYVRKLGLEIKDVEGLIGVFDDFEGAATAASKLAQAFGMNVDAMQMMQEQDPAKRLDSLRQAFAATGKSIESMSRQEKALLAQTAGLDENTVSLALSTENMGMSYDEIQKAAEESGDKQLSQAEIMQKTSENIERLIQNLNQTTGSFLDTFLNGFMKGISQTKEFKAMMQALSQALIKTYQFGVKVGDAFVKAFPGVKDIFNSITSFFKSFDLSSSTESIQEFFNMFSTAGGAEKALKKLFGFFDKGTKGAMGFFDSQGPFMKAIKTFGSALLNAFNAFIPIATDYVVKKLDDLISWVSGAMDDMFNVDSKKVMSPLGKLFNNLYTAVEKILPKLWDLMTTIFGKLWENPKVKKVLMGVLAAAGAWIFSSAALALLGSLASAVISTFFTTVVAPAIISGFTAALGGAAASGGLATAVAGFVTSAIALLSNPVGWAVLAGLLLIAIGAALASMLKSMGKESFLETLGIDPNSWIGGLVGGWFDSITGSLDLLIDGFSQFFTGLWDAVSALLEGDTAKFQDSFMDALMGLGEGLLGAFGLIGNMIMAGLAAQVALLGTTLKLAFKALKVLLLTQLDIITWPFRKLAEMFGVNIPSPSEMFDSIAGPLKAGFDKIADFFGFGGSGTQEVVAAAEGAGQQIAEAATSAGEEAAAGMSDGITAGLEEVPKTAEEQLGSVTSLVGDYSGKTTEEIALKAEEINKGLDNIKNLVSNIDQSKISAIDSAVKGLNTKALESAGVYMEGITSGISRVVDPLRDVMNTMNELITVSSQVTPATIEKAMVNVGKVLGTVYKISTPLEEMYTKTRSELLDLYYSPMGGIVHAIVEDIKAVNESLAELGTVDINATIAKVGGALGLKDEILKVESKPIQMNVNINLTMKADDIAKEIMDVTAKIAKDKDKASDGMKDLFPGYAQ